MFEPYFCAKCGLFFDAIRRGRVRDDKKAESLFLHPAIIPFLATVSAVIVDAVFNTTGWKTVLIISVLVLLISAIIAWISVILIDLMLPKKVFSDTVDSIRQLHNISATMSVGSFFGDIRKRMIMEDDLVGIEQSAKCVWVVSRSLLGDTRNIRFKEIVCENLRNDTRYVWVIPDSAAVRNRIDELRNYWDKKGIDYSQCVSFKRILSGNFVIPNDLCIYNAGIDNLDTRVIEFISDRHRHVIGFELTGETGEEIAGIIGDWIRNS